MIPDKDTVLPLVVLNTDPFGAREAQRDADWLVVVALAEALEWALDEGGWQLPYYASNVPACLKPGRRVPYEVAQRAEIDWDLVIRKAPDKAAGRAGRHVEEL